MEGRSLVYSWPRVDETKCRTKPKGDVRGSRHACDSSGSIHESVFCVRIQEETLGHVSYPNSNAAWVVYVRTELFLDYVCCSTG